MEAVTLRARYGKLNIVKQNGKKSIPPVGRNRVPLEPLCENQEALMKGRGDVEDTILLKRDINPYQCLKRANVLVVGV